MRRLAAVALIVLLVAVLWSWLGGEDAAPVTAPEDVVGDVQAAPTPRLAGEEEDVAARETLAPVPEPVVPEETVTAPAPVPPAAGPSMLHGSAVRVDVHGTEHVGDDGRFELYVRQGTRREKREVEVVGGRWSVEVPPGVSLYVSDVVLADRSVLLDNREYTVPESGFLELRGRERADVLLHVVSAAAAADAASGRGLSGVDVWGGPYRFATAIQHPGVVPDEPALVRDAASPVRIPQRPDDFGATSQYFVRAPGHAWGTITVDHSAGGERTLVLQPECALEVSLVGNEAWLEPEVRLWLPEASNWDAYAFAKRAPDEEDRAVFEQLPPGTYIVSVERGWADRRESYGRAKVELIAGERASVTVHVTPPERPEPVVVEGTLTVPDAWETADVRLEFGGEGDTEKWLSDELVVAWSAMRRVEGGGAAGERRAWSVELPRSGMYRVEVEPLVVRRALEVPADGLRDVDLVVPAPADVEVLVLDDTTGEELTVESLHWSGGRVEGIVATPLYTAVRDPRVGRVTFRAPAGELQIRPRGRELMEVDRSSSFNVVPGHNEVELRVVRQIGVRFTFLDGDATIPWNWKWRLSAHQVDGDARDQARGVGVMWFQQEGTYELRSEGIPGYHPVDGFRFEVVDGQGMVEVTVRLERE